MIKVTPMYRDEDGEWKHGPPIYVNPDSIVFISEILDDEEIGSMILIPDEDGHGRLFLAQDVDEVLARMSHA